MEVEPSNFIWVSRSEEWRRGRLRGLGESGRSSRRAVDALRLTALDPALVKIPPIVGEGAKVAWEEIGC